jgi:hypothetical protein
MIGHGVMVSQCSVLLEERIGWSNTQQEDKKK